MAELARPRMAILDKNPHVRELLCREFEGLGFAASSLRDGAELLHLLASVEPPQVVVLDPEAPGAVGGEVRARLAALSVAGQVAVVLHVFADAESSQAALLGLPQALVAEKRPDLVALRAAVDKALRAAPGPAGPQTGNHKERA